MIPDYMKPFLREALGKSLKSGTATFVEEMADTLGTTELRNLVNILQKVLAKRTDEKTVDAKVVDSK
jgi:hypothetical protein